MTTLAIVDDHEALREGPARLLGAAGLEVVGMAGTVVSGRDLVELDRSDVALIDIRLPDGTGIDPARRLLADADREA